MYLTPHDHRLYGRGHGERVEATIALGKTIILPEICSGADLSCGNGEIIKALALTRTYLGDFAPGYELCGALDDTIQQIPLVDLFVCSETIEHLDNPLKALMLIRMKSEHLLLSTPVDNFADTNAEHLWGWDREGVENLLHLVGFTVIDYDQVDSRVYGEPYCYGIWSCG